MAVHESVKFDALEKLAAAAKSSDTEKAHADADDVLCGLLVDLGFEDVVAAYNKVGKWYA